MASDGGDRRDAEPAEITEAERLARIRELLVGEAMRAAADERGDLGRRLDALADAQGQQLSALKDEVAARFEALETRLSEDAADLNQALEAGRADAKDDLAQALGELNQRLEGERASIDAAIAEATAVTEREVATLQTALAAVSERLGEAKTDRRELARILSDMAARLDRGDDADDGAKLAHAS